MIKNYAKVITAAVVAVYGVTGYFAIREYLKGEEASRGFDARQRERTCCIRLESEMLRIAKATNDTVMLTLEDELRWCGSDKLRGIQDDERSLSEYIRLNLFKNDRKGAELYIGKICQGINE